MTFEQYIHSTLKSMLGDLFEDRVYSSNLPDNFNFHKPTLVVQYKLNEQLKTLDGIENMQDYECQLVIITSDSEELALIAVDVVDRLEDYEDAHILDITLVDDLNTADIDEGYYLKSLNYSLVYVK